MQADEKGIKVGTTKYRSRSGLKEQEDRWERAGARDAAWREHFNIVDNLEGDWDVQRLSGPLPMPFVWKRIRGSRGETYALPFGPKFPFRLEQREGHVVLIYRAPLTFMVDELRLEADGAWLGRAYAAGFRYAWFLMVPM